MTDNIFTRETFTTSIRYEYLTVEGLRNQTGHPPEEWPLVVLKELLDNALDACEDKRIPPKIRVRVNDQGITVIDNGPGIPKETLAKLVDPDTRVSSRKAYVSPTRGAQGNAMKTILGMPFVLDGQRGEVVIEAKGIRHMIRVKADRIRQEPDVQHYAFRDSLVKSGTLVQVKWPPSASSLLETAKWRFLQMADSFTFLNPHLTLQVDWFGETWEWEATQLHWVKYLPCHPTCSHWYDQGRMEERILACLRKDEEEKEDRTVREFLKQFSGFKGSENQGFVLHETGLTGLALSALRNGNDLDHGRVAKLLESMQEYGKRIKPAALGTIGKEHFMAHIQDLGANRESFKYKRLHGFDDNGIPYVLECAFAWYPDNERRLITGINWSPGILNPFRTLGLSGDGLDDLLARWHLADYEEVIVAIHLAYPRAEFTNRGKDQLVISESGQHVGEDDTIDPDDQQTGLGRAFVRGVYSVSRNWCKQREREHRDASAKQRRAERLRSKSNAKTQIKEAAWEVMADAYREASSGDRRLPAKARQIFYRARPRILQITGLAALNDQYFCQTLLPDYMNEFPEKTKDWNVVFDARGHLTEPHTHLIVPLGTLEVREYLAKRVGQVEEDGPSFRFSSSLLWPTHGPKHRYGALLYIEKEGFDALFQATRLAERYDIAIMSNKGLSVTASRELVDHLCSTCSEEGIPLLVLHDFDKSGFSIVGTIQRSNRRYTFQYEIKAFDLGLRLSDAGEWNLDSEPVNYKRKAGGKLAKFEASLRKNLTKNGATEEEINFLYTGNWEGKRVELNAFTSGDFIEFIEAKLEEHGIKKVVPDPETLVAHYRQVLKTRIVNQQLVQIANEAQQKAAEATVPEDLEEQVRELQKDSPATPWDMAISEIAKEASVEPS
jgi:hypothetical protein